VQGTVYDSKKEGEELGSAFGYVDLKAPEAHNTLCKGIKHQDSVDSKQF
jgi:hypothetical protein